MCSRDYARVVPGSFAGQILRSAVAHKLTTAAHIDEDPHSGQHVDYTKRCCLWHFIPNFVYSAGFSFCWWAGGGGADTEINTLIFLFIFLFLDAYA